MTITMPFALFNSYELRLNIERNRESKTLLQTTITTTVTICPPFDPRKPFSILNPYATE